MEPPAAGLFGRVIRALATPSARAEEREYYASLVAEAHAHEHTYVSIVLDGATVERFGSRVEELTTAQVQLMTAGERHSNAYPVQTRCLHIEADRIVEQLAAAGGSVPVGPRRDARAIVFARSISEEFRRADAVSPLAIDGLLYALLARTSGHAARTAGGPTWVDRVLEVLHDSFAEKLTLDELAAVAGVHPAHLCREFHRRTGQTVGGYVRQLRLAHAIRLLLESERSLAEIALDCGFADQSHFTSVFHRAMGVTPSRYRRLRSG